MARVTTTSNGSVASFKSPVKAPINSLKVSLSPKQSGTGDPSLSNVRPITGWTGVDVAHTGVNVWNEQIVSGGIDTDGTVNTADSLATRITTSFIPVQGGQTYYQKAPAEAGSGRVAYYDEDKNVVSVNISSGVPANSTFTVPTGAKYMRITFAAAYGTTYKNDISINYPSTDTSYHAYTGSDIPVPFPALGKNLFDKTYMSDINNYPNYYSDYYYTDAIVLNPNETYTLSPTSTALLSTTRYYVLKIGSYQQAGQTYYPVTAGTPTEIKFTTDSTGEICFGTYRTNDALPVFMSIDWQLELGSSATSYQPYVNTVYGGTVDLATGEIVGTARAITIDSSTTFQSVFSSDNVYGAGLSFAKNSTASVQDLILACNSLPVVYQEPTANDLPCVYPRVYNSTTVFLYVCCLSVSEHPEITTVDAVKEAAKNWLSTNDLSVTVVHKRAVPFTASMNPYQLTTLLGQNTFWSDADSVEVGYDPIDSPDIVKARQRIVASQPHLETKSAAVASFKTDVPAKLEECKVSFSPVQDLHGYDKPWPPGGGKNLITSTEYNGALYDKQTSTDLKVNGTRATLAESGNQITITTTAEWYGFIFATGVLAAGNYHIHWTNSNSDTRTSIYITDNDLVSESLVRSVSTFTGDIDENVTLSSSGRIAMYIGRYTSGSITVSNLQVEAGTSFTSWMPYENICPIEGITGLTVHETGKNLIDTSKLTSGLWWYGNIDTQYPNYRATEKISVIPGHTYYLLRSSVSQGYCSFFDKDKKYLRQRALNSNGVTVKPASDEFYIGITIQKEYVSTAYFSIDSSDHDYESYYGNHVSVEFPALGKNLFPPDQREKTVNNIRYFHDGTGITLKAGTYTVSTSEQMSGLYVNQYSGGSNNTIETKYNSTYLTFTLNAETSGINFNFYKESISDTLNFQFEEGSSATTYEPYTKTVYGGELDLKTGELTVKYGGVTLTGNENVAWNSQYGFFSFPTYIANKKNWESDIYCSCYPTVGDGTITYFGAGNDPNTVWLYMTQADPYYGDKTALKNLFAQLYANNTPMQFAWKYATPITYQLTPSQLKAFKGANNIWSDTNGTVSVKYWTH